ncbi:4-hydroxythreonine-4-phosphate dehydrogenase [Amylibacter marinus]|uniref:4-hydroxythreonine-4-phosphate dehydrogenase n=1 Tax=Amylibacter marinus TaxID=1475483 RepID=A0ABQ5VRY4_9RHOB|nr:4-hydroxythreonine-4-phosphate dehydrogenase PdxA [Amylibacter marinus]GLQ34126.1 4-hydroxythreonine-4-phosphate dehydrogenase [Amylibacter marinus]
MMPPIALTCGDPNGVGIDISLMAAQRLVDTPFFLIADKQHVESRDHNGIHHLIERPADVLSLPQGRLGVLHHQFSARPTLTGEQGENARDIIAVIERGVHLVKSGAASALCTNPIHKKVLVEGAGFAYPGHTEFLAALAGIKRSVMMLACDELRVVPVTIHIALSDVQDHLTPELLLETIEITHKSLIEDHGIPNPRIAVAGLNPHAGEGGTFGRSEIDMMQPLIHKLRAQGMDISDPISADTMFHAEARARYDVAICMYHDQALIPIKTLDFHGGVNVTLGLPFIRTSPDHGTAFALAGGPDANPSSLIAALKYAHKLAQNRKTNVDT